jgi:hypothetical protein
LVQSGSRLFDHINDTLAQTKRVFEDENDGTASRLVSNDNATANEAGRTGVTVYERADVNSVVSNEMNVNKNDKGAAEETGKEESMPNSNDTNDLTQNQTGHQLDTKARYKQLLKTNIDLTSQRISLLAKEAELRSKMNRCSALLGVDIVSSLSPESIDSKLKRTA